MNAMKNLDAQWAVGTVISHDGVFLTQYYGGVAHLSA
jgi:hypothetical protein